MAKKAFSHGGKLIVSKPRDAQSGVESEDQLTLEGENLYFQGSPLTLQH